MRTRSAAVLRRSVWRVWRRDAIRLRRAPRGSLPQARRPTHRTFEASQGLTPERRLRFALLEETLRVLVGVGSRSGSASRRAVADARDWVLSDDTKWPFSFQNVCDALNIDADGLRRRLAPWLSSTLQASGSPGELSIGIYS